MAVSTKTKAAPMKAPTKVERLEKRLSLIEIEVKIYRELGRLSSDGKNRDALYKRMLDLALKTVEAEAGTLYFVKSSTRELVFKMVKGPRSRTLKGMKIRSDSGIAGHVASTGKPYLSANLQTDKYWLGLTPGGKQRNMIAVPLKVKRKVVGVIEAINKVGAKEFSKGDLKVLTSVVNHLALIIERSDFLSDLEDKLEQFATLNDVGALLISSLDEKVVRERALKAITRLMHAEAGSLLLVDEEKDELYFEVALGEKSEKIKEIRLKIGEGIAGWVARHGKSVLVPNAATDKRFQHRVDRRSSFKTMSMVCIPVKIKGKVIGVLQAINRTDGSFTRDDMRLFQLFGNQVAIALDNARLHEEIRETFYATSGALADAIEKRDPYTGGHTQRVLRYSMAIGRQLGLDPGMMEKLKLSAVLHDIGKIGIDDSILKKQAPLNKEEAISMMRHPKIGVEIMGHVPQLKEIIPGMLYHHERPDGKGYPFGFKGDKIPLVARIISVSDTYDAMTTDRPYRKGLSRKVAVDELEKFSGEQFDAKVVKAFTRAIEDGEIDQSLSAEASDADAGETVDAK